jgi:lipid II:glycine glycyltransferase (peptidoglycan interpeptide bridge formation enzyme)
VWKGFSDWCHDNGVVAEFIRFNPFIENYRLADKDCQLWTDRQLVVVDLKGSEEDFWSRYSSNHRNSVRKAIQSNVTCEESFTAESKLAFERLHELTMRRNLMPESAYLSEAFYHVLWNELAPHLKLFVARYEGQIIASGLFTVCDGFMHYQYGNSDRQYQSYAPNNLLIHTAAKWGAEHHFSQLNLGGGRTRNDDDALFKFKSRISTGRLPYRLGKCVRHSEAYNALCSSWLRTKGETVLPPYSFPYRLT